MDRSTSPDGSIPVDASSDDGSASARDGSDAPTDVDARSDVFDAGRDGDGGLPPNPMDVASDDGSSPPSGDSAVDGDAGSTPDASDDQADVTDSSADDASDGAVSGDAPSDQADAMDDTADGSAASGFPGSALVDTSQGAMINGWVGTPTQLWKLCYSTALHTKSGAAFHANCDFKGPSVSIARVSFTTETRVIGGYNSSSWYSPATPGYSNNAGSFLFSVTNAFKHDFPGSSSVNYYVFNNANYGPTFGAGNDWYVHSQMTMGTCRPGYTYQCRVGMIDTATCNVDFCGTPTSSDYYTLEALEVWVK